MDIFVTMLGIGLITSVHCVAMCGTMVLTYAVKDGSEGPLGRRLLPHFAYQGAKISSYVLVGLGLGALGAALNLTGLRGWVTLFAGAFMILLGLNMTGRFPALNRFSLRPPKFLVSALSRTRKKAAAESASGEAHIATPVTFGALTGLMPCGPLQTAQLAAAGAGSATAGAMAMLGFGLGTMPLMLGFGAVAGALGARAKQAMNLVAALVIIGLGLVMLNRGSMIVGSPVTFQSVKQAVLGGPAPTSQYAEGADGVVEVPLVIENVRFIPEALAVPADRPVRLVVERREDNACSDQLAIPQLGVLANLTPFGITVVDLPAARAGAYTLTCGMGMMAGRLLIGGGGTATSPVGVFAIGAAIALGGFVLRRRRSLAELGGASSRGAKSGSASSAAKLGKNPATALPFGLTREEIIVGAVAIGAAVLVGLSLGGMFR